MTESQSNDPTYPLMPAADDDRWQSATIRARRQKSSTLRSLPHLRLSRSLSHVFAGDTVEVIREVRFEEWIAAKVGYQLGWLNTLDVDFVIMRPINTPDEAPRRLQRDPEMETKPFIATIPDEIDEPTSTAPTTPPEDPASKKPTRPFVELRDDDLYNDFVNDDDDTLPAWMQDITEEPTEEVQPILNADDDIPRDDLAETLQSEIATRIRPPARPRQSAATNTEDEAEVRLTSSEVNRLIRYLKGIADTLAAARERSRRGD